MRNRTLRFVLSALAILVFPLLATILRFEGWNWSPFDFVVVGVLLVGASYALVYATTAGATRRNRVVGFTIVGALIALYVHIAVGIVDWLPLAGN